MSSCDTPQTKEEAIGIRYANLSDADKALHCKRNSNLISHRNHIPYNSTPATSLYKKKLRKYQGDLIEDDQFDDNIKTLATLFDKMSKNKKTNIYDELSCNKNDFETSISKTHYFETSDGISSNPSVKSNKYKTNLYNSKNDIRMDISEELTLGINNYNSNWKNKVKDELEKFEQEKILDSMFGANKKIDNIEKISQDNQIISGLEFKRNIKKEADAALFDICCRNNQNFSKEEKEKLQKVNLN